MTKNRGVTLVELVAALAIIAMIMAAAAPGVMAFLPRWRLKSAAFDLFSSLHQARITAIRRGERCCLTYSPDRYSLSLPASGVVLKTVALADYGGRVRFKGPPPDCHSYRRAQITFNARGLSNAGYAYLSAEKANVYYRVGPTTAGVIKLQKLVGKKWR